MSLRGRRPPGLPPSAGGRPGGWAQEGSTFGDSQDPDQGQGRGGGRFSITIGHLKREGAGMWRACPQGTCRGTPAL